MQCFKNKTRNIKNVALRHLAGVSLGFRTTTLADGWGRFEPEARLGTLCCPIYLCSNTFIFYIRTCKWSTL